MTDDKARLIFLLILLVPLVLQVFMGGGTALFRKVQHSAVWFLIFAGFIATYGMWPELKRSLLPRAAIERNGAVELRAASDGHFYVDTLINGQPVTFLIDTGASNIVLSTADARKVGFNPAKLSYTDQAATANGLVGIAPVRLNSLVLGPHEDRDLNASVNAGDIDMSLLGMSYLRRYQLTFSGNTLSLKR